MRKSILSSSNYLLSTLVVKGAPFISVLLLKKCWDNSLFGDYMFIVSTLPVISIIIGFSLVEVYRRAYYEEDSNILIPYVGNYFFKCLFFGSVVLTPICFYYFEKRITLAILVVSYAVASELLQLLLVSKNVKGEHRRFLWISIIRSVIPVIFIVLFQNTYWLRIESLLLIEIFLIFYIVLTNELPFSLSFKNVLMKSDRAIKYILILAVPFFAHRIAGIIMNVFDVLTLDYFVTKAELGSYAFSYKVGSIPLMFHAGLSLYFRPKIFESLAKNNLINSEKNFNLWQFFLVFFSALFYSVLLLFDYVTNGGLEISWYVVTIVIVSNLVIFLYERIGTYLFFEKQVKYNAIIMLIGAGANIGLNIVLLKKGYVDLIAAASLVGFIVVYCCYYFYAISKMNISVNHAKANFMISGLVLFTLIYTYESISRS